MGWHRAVKIAHKHFKRNLSSGGKFSSAGSSTQQPAAGPDMGAAATAAGHNAASSMR